MKAFLLLFLTAMFLVYIPIKAQNPYRTAYIGIVANPRIAPSIHQHHQWTVKSDLGIRWNKFLTTGVQPYLLKTADVPTPLPQPDPTFFRASTIIGMDIYASFLVPIRKITIGVEAGLGSGYIKTNWIDKRGQNEFVWYKDRYFVLGGFIGPVLQYAITEQWRIVAKVPFWYVANQAFYNQFQDLRAFVPLLGFQMNIKK